MINGVLVERTVKDVIPALKTNSEGLKKVLEELVKQYKKQQDEMEKWKVFPLPLIPSPEVGHGSFGVRLTTASSLRRKTIFKSCSSRAER